FEGVPEEFVPVFTLSTSPVIAKVCTTSAANVGLTREVPTDLVGQASDHANQNISELPIGQLLVRVHREVAEEQRVADLRRDQVLQAGLVRSPPYLPGHGVPRGSGDVAVDKEGNGAMVAEKPNCYE